MQRNAAPSLEHAACILTTAGQHLISREVATDTQSGNDLIVGRPVQFSQRHMILLLRAPLKQTYFLILLDILIVRCSV